MTDNGSCYRAAASAKRLADAADLAREHPIADSTVPAPHARSVRTRGDRVTPRFYVTIGAFNFAARVYVQ